MSIFIVSIDAGGFQKLKPPESNVMPLADQARRAS